MTSPRAKLIRIILIGGVGLFIIGTIIWVVISNNTNRQQTSIKGYDQKVKNLPETYKKSIEGALRDMIAYNGVEDSRLDSVKDALIRDGTATQNEVSKDSRYTGEFIVDIKSIQQSYRVQYEYSKNPADGESSGYPVLVSCLTKDKLIYGDFSCRERYKATSKNVKDPIISSLPYASLSFRLSADATGDKLVLRAELRIPAIDLSGNEASRRQTVALYKREVTKWMESKGFKPENYTIIYNYLDDGTASNTSDQRL